MIAYFSMEIGVDPQVPTYAGGLGVLAGDTVRAAADLGLPFVAVTLLHRHGYVHQRLDAAGRQREEPAVWSVEHVLAPLAARVSVSLNGRPVVVRAWRHTVAGIDGASVPVIFLDTDLEENTPEDARCHTTCMAATPPIDSRKRRCSGLAGCACCAPWGTRDIQRFHLNEGHSALLTSELVAERLRSGRRTTVTDDDCDAVRRLCVFTTHTPVSAALDRFPPELVEQVLGPTPLSQLWHQCCYEGVLNMTHLALHFSHYINGVAMRHGEVSRRMFNGYVIDAITNGVHAATWVSPSFACAVRSAHWRLAARQLQPSLRRQHPPARHLGCARRRQTAVD
jgi:starch phosphorylase